MALTVGQTYRMALKMHGNLITCLVNGTSIISVLDYSIAPAGRAGVYFAQMDTDSTGYHLDNFSASTGTNDVEQVSSPSGGTQVAEVSLDSHPFNDAPTDFTPLWTFRSELDVLTSAPFSWTGYPDFYGDARPSGGADGKLTVGAVQIPPSAPGEVYASQIGGGEVEIDWDSATLDNGHSNITEYGVSRATSSSGPWTSIGLVDAGDGENYFIDTTGVSVGTTYYYEVSDGDYGDNASAAAITSGVTITTPTTPPPVASKVAIWDPDTESFYIQKTAADYNLADAIAVQYSKSSFIPVSGDWAGLGTGKATGVFDPATGVWYLDFNDNNKAGERVDAILKFGQAGDVPVVGDWTGNGTAKIGVWRPSSPWNGTGTFILDYNGDGVYDTGDVSFQVTVPWYSTNPNDTYYPIAGRWWTTGAAQIGFFDSTAHTWYLDQNLVTASTHVWTVYNNFGNSGDLPVIGDWGGSGIDKIGVYQPADYTYQFGLDADDNGYWDRPPDIWFNNFGYDSNDQAVSI